MRDKKLYLDGIRGIYSFCSSASNAEIQQIFAKLKINIDDSFNIYYGILLWLLWLSLHLYALTNW